MIFGEKTLAEVGGSLLQVSSGKAREGNTILLQPLERSHFSSASGAVSKQSSLITTPTPSPPCPAWGFHSHVIYPEEQDYSMDKIILP